jgi:hypothetical protein
VISNEPEITPTLVAEHGLKPEEYQRILDLIGRTPSFTELGICQAGEVLLRGCGVNTALCSAVGCELFTGLAEYLARTA